MSCKAEWMESEQSSSQFKITGLLTENVLLKVDICLLNKLVKDR